MIALLVACTASSLPRRRPPAPAPVPHAEVLPPGWKEIGTLEGDVTDSRTHEKVAGALISVHIDSGELTQITDETGHYALFVPAGPHEILCYYADSKVADNVVVASGGTTTASYSFDTTAIDARAERLPRATCPETAERQAVARDYHAIVAAALQHVLGDPETRRGNEELFARAPIYVLDEIQVGIDGERHRITDTELRAVDVRLKARSWRELRAEADDLRRDVWFVRWHRVQFEGACAWPGSFDTTREGGPCSDEQLFHEHAGRWSYVGKVTSMCP